MSVVTKDQAMSGVHSIGLGNLRGYQGPVNV